MKPVEFKEQNVVFGKGQPESQDLPAYLNRTKETGEAVTCWEISDEELEEIVKTKRIWLNQLTFHSPFQPIAPSISKPDCLKKAKVKCPECLKEISQHEYFMFGGLCEECTIEFE